ncbi:hypothetical protein Purlil1_5644 [Purpureocillium lilacinum]|uniref:Uncharacterized protein n=1 Tax=Purpureocillium lilacinum TaxID=33203 RepID=A0ABR0C2S4_PURLI|nr:hypothetical protein Purlil1_5644 [Purpureocillium lilacinum]
MPLRLLVPPADRPAASDVDGGVFVCLRVRARDRIKRQAAGGRSVPCSLARSLAPDRMGPRVEANVPRCLAGIGQQRCRDTGLLLHGRLQARIVGRICGRTGINAEPTPCPGPANTMIAPTVVVTPRRFRHARHMQADGGAPAGCKGGEEGSCRPGARGRLTRHTPSGSRGDDEMGLAAADAVFRTTFTGGIATRWGALPTWRPRLRHEHRSRKLSTLAARRRCLHLMLVGWTWSVPEQFVQTTALSCHLPFTGVPMTGHRQGPSVVSRSPQTAAAEPQRAIWKEGISQEGMEGQAPAKKGPAPGPETPPHAPPRGAIRTGPRWRQKGRGVEAGDVSPSKARDGGVIGSLAHVTGPTPPVMGIGSGSAHNATRGGLRDAFVALASSRLLDVSQEKPPLQQREPRRLIDDRPAPCTNHRRMRPCWKLWKVGPQPAAAPGDLGFGGFEREFANAPPRRQTHVGLPPVRPPSYPPSIL